MNIRDQIQTVFSDVATAQGKRLAPLSDDLALMDTGLDSLCLAIVIARLEHGRIELSRGIPARSDI